MLILVFDTETTGLHSKPKPSYNNTKQWPHIIQLSYVLYETTKFKIVKCVDNIIRLDDSVEISEESINVHGITRSISKRKGIDIKVAINEFMDDLQNVECIVGHNLQFDKDMIIVETVRMNNMKVFTNLKEYCTMKNGKIMCNIKKVSLTGEPYLKYPRLTELHEKIFNKIPNGAHDSLADVLICLRCYIKMTTNVDIRKKKCNIFNELYGLYCD